MASSEELGAYVSQIAPQSVQEEYSKGEGYMLPKPPKKGELMYCQMCGKPIYTREYAQKHNIDMSLCFSEDKKTRISEFKWQVHNACKERAFDMADRQTPGLLGEREADGVPKQ